MSRSHNKRRHQTNPPVDAPPFKKRAYLQLATGSHLPVPYSVLLSPTGVLSFIWQSPGDWTAQGSPRNTNQPPREVVGTLWRKFLALSEGSDEDIRKFAERWGSLRIGSEETVTDWRRFAVLGNALVQVATAVRRNGLGREGDWDVIRSWLQSNASPFAAPQSRLDSDVSYLRKFLIVRAINKWFIESSGNLLVQLIKGQLTIQPSSSSLLGIVIVQLAEHISRIQNLFLCFHCQALMLPKRVPSRGIRQFCAQCRKKKKPQMYAARDYRRRQVAARNAAVII